MIVDLVRTTTTDGHRLDGALSAAVPVQERLCSLDACLFLHGVGGNFYAGNLFEFLGRKLCEQGTAVLRANTRGHDSISIVWGATGPLRQGAAYEVVDQCRLDIVAWLQFLKARNYQRIGLIGHSLGAIKAIYSQAFEPHSDILAVVACSPPRLSYSAFMNSESQPRFFESMATAQQHLEKGHPEELFQASFPFPVLITAAGYIDKYGPEERYNILKFVGRVPCPLMLTYGELELERGGIAFAGMPEAIVACRQPTQLMQLTTIPGADHAYTGVYESLTDAILKWLTAALPKSPLSP